MVRHLANCLCLVLVPAAAPACVDFPQEALGPKRTMLSQMQVRTLGFDWCWCHVPVQGTDLCKRCLRVPWVCRDVPRQVRRQGDGAKWQSGNSRKGYRYSGKALA